MGIKKTISFLQNGTQLLYLVNPSGEYDKQLLANVGRNLDENQSPGGNGIPIILEEEQNISFSISSNNNLQKKLKSCKCTSSAVPEKILKSINDACQSREHPTFYFSTVGNRISPDEAVKVRDNQQRTV